MLFLGGALGRGCAAYRPCDLAAAQAGCAHAGVLGPGRGLYPCALQVRPPQPLGLAVGVADVVTGMRPLAADIAHS